MQAFQAASLLSFIFHICSTQVIWGGNISGQKYSCITWNMDFNAQILCSLKWPEWCLNCIHWIGWWIRLNTQRVNKKLWILIAWNISWIPSSHSVKIDDTHSTPAGVGLCSLSYELVYNWFFFKFNKKLDWYILYWTRNGMQVTKRIDLSICVIILTWKRYIKERLINVSVIKPDNILIIWVQQN